MSALVERSVGAELLVVGSHGHRGVKGALIGSVAHQCARLATCAVVVARLDAFDPDPELTIQGKRSHPSVDPYQGQGPTHQAMISSQASIEQGISRRMRPS